MRKITRPTPPKKTFTGRPFIEFLEDRRVLSGVSTLGPSPSVANPPPASGPALMTSPASVSSPGVSTATANPTSVAPNATPSFNQPGFVVTNSPARLIVSDIASMIGLGAPATGDDSANNSQPAAIDNSSQTSSDSGSENSTQAGLQRSDQFENPDSQQGNANGTNSSRLGKEDTATQVSIIVSCNEMIWDPSVEAIDPGLEQVTVTHDESITRQQRSDRQSLERFFAAMKPAATLTVQSEGSNLANSSRSEISYLGEMNGRPASSTDTLFGAHGNVWNMDELIGGPSAGHHELSVCRWDPVLVRILDGEASGTSGVELQDSPAVSVGLSSGAIPADGISLEIALQDFIRQIGNLGEQLGRSMESLGLAPWILTLTMASTAYEFSRRSKRRATPGATEECASLSWFAGLSESLSTEYS